MTKNKFIINKTIIGLVIIFILVYLANLMFPITFDDDFAYAEAGNPFLLQWQEYLNWHGRYLTHTIGRLILQLRDPAVNIIMAFMTTGFMISVGHFMRPRFWQSDDKQNLTILIVVSFALSLLIKSWIAYTETMFFVAYFLSFVFLLLFLVHYFEFIKNGDEEDKKRESPSSSIKIFVLGILAGFTHEQSVATIPLLILMIIYLKYQKRSIPSWFYIGFLGFVIGFAMLMLAPSVLNGGRDGYGNNWNFLGQTYKWNELGFEKYFYNLAKILLFGSFPWIVYGLPFFTIFGVLFHKNLKLNPDWTKQIAPLLMFVYSWGVICVMMFVPMFHAGPMNFGLLFLYLSVGMELQLYLKQNPDFFPKLKKITIGSVVLALVMYVAAIPAWLSYHREYHQIVAQIQEAKSQNLTEVTVKPFTLHVIKTPLGNIKMVGLYTTHTFYRRMAKYYDIEKITPQ